MCLAIPGKIIAIEATDDQLMQTAKVSFGGIIKEVNLSLVPEAEINDYVLVHVGVAINKIDQVEADKVFQYLNEIGEVEEQLSGKDQGT